MSQWVSRRKVWFLRLSLSLSALLFAIYLGEMYLIHDLEQSQRVTDISSALINLIATFGLVIAAIHSQKRSKQIGLAWIILAIAQFSYFLGDLSWAILEVWLKIEPFPSVADAFYLAFYPLFFASLLLMSDRPAGWAGWVRKSLESGMVMIAALLGFWNFILGPYAIQNSGGPWLNLALSLAYPVGDLLILWGLLVLLYQGIDQNTNSYLPPSIIWLGVSGLMMIGSDTAFSIQSLMGTYTSGGLTDLGWIASYLSMGLAGVYQAAAMSPDYKRSISLSPLARISAFRKKVISILPYAALVLAFALLILRHEVSMPMGFLSMALWVSLLIAMVLVRQMMILAENKQLVKDLHATLEYVKQQSVEMERSNLQLQEEVIERKRMESQLSYDALHDRLTGLPNRTLFIDRLRHAIAYRKHHTDNLFAVLFLDLDHFKVVNDSLGHAAGDELLIAIAMRLRENLRDSDAVARFGGDEFVVLVEDVQSESALAKIIEKLQNVLQMPFMLGDRTVFTTASIGVVTQTAQYTTPEEMIRDADIALYHAKANGKACYTIFNPELGTQAHMRLELENELRRAIEQGEFLLYYQPIYNLDTVTLSGFEALIRWRHPHLGVILPDMFIQVAEEAGLILPIGDWVLRQACQQMHAWHTQYPDMHKLTISVNISSKQFSQPNFAEYIADVLQETGLDPLTLKLEITENVIILNPIFAREVFTRLSQLGVQLQIDDFGTGYSSLSYLQQYPFHSIKIDRSFIQTMSQSRKNTNLVRTMIRMAHDLGMEAVAEGIETEEQKAFLQGLDCQYGQGFLMSRALDAQTAEQVIQGPAPIIVSPIYSINQQDSPSIR